MKRLLSVGTALLVTLVLVSACGGDGGEDHNAQDVSFATDMIPHHEQAVTMSDLALAQAASPQVKALATRIKAAQGPEITTMQGWLSTWGEKEADGGHGGHGGQSTDSGQGMLSDGEMGNLRAASGTAFDRMFLEGMTLHHKGAVEMAKLEQEKGKFPAAKELAGRIIADQEREIAEMAEILRTLA